MGKGRGIARMRADRRGSRAHRQAALLGFVMPFSSKLRDFASLCIRERPARIATRHPPEPPIALRRRCMNFQQLRAVREAIRCGFN
ncbi:MAG: hypothetical protein QFE16_09695, partial [Pseudomonadota bacterium]|nr:hypothetical protein [Pseudomonadota bacterium]